MLVSFEEEDTTKTVFVDYRVRSDFLDPVVLTSEFGVTPTRSWAKNEEYISKALDPETRKTIQVKRKHPWGIWAVETRGLISSKKVEQHVLYLLDKLEPRKERIKRFLSKKNKYVISFYIRWEPVEIGGGYEVTSQTLRRMTSLCHYIEFNFENFTNGK